VKLTKDPIANARYNALKSLLITYKSLKVNIIKILSFCIDLK